MGLGQFVAGKLVKPLLSAYLRRERAYRYKGFSLRISPGVFHPAFFFSSKYLFEFIDRLKLDGKACLEIGCGSGLLSLLMASKTGRVTAIDISAQAVKDTINNFERNKARLAGNYQVLQSDLFTELPPQAFEVIVINPPYFFNEAVQESQHAWNCGPNGEYFEKLFSGLANYIHAQSEVYMILADNCDIDRISAIARSHKFNLVLQEKKKIWWEVNSIFRVKPGLP